MEIIYSDENININNSVVVLGNFDGVHYAHRKLVEKAVCIAKEKNLKVVVYTFSQHPKKLLGKKVEILTTNSEKEALFNKMGVDRITLSIEMQDYEIQNVMNKCNSDIEIVIYGRVELMIMKYCPLKELINNCSVCKNNPNKYYLVSKDKKRYPIIHSNCYTSIMHYENIDKINKINEYMEYGINNYRIELFDENKEEVSRLIDLVKRNFT